jgi:hypothetical protein
MLTVKLSPVKLNICYETLRTALDQEGLFGTTQAPEIGYEIWYMEF